MTDEQIKLNAEVYAKKQYDIPFENDSSINVIVSEESYIAGAHSRDEEIEELKEEIESLKENEKELFEGFKKSGTKLGELMKENVKLLNPWISVEDRLPEEDPYDKRYSVEVIGMFPDDSVSKCFYWIEESMWFIDGFTCGKPTHWMPIPELKKGK